VTTNTVLPKNFCLHSQMGHEVKCELGQQQRCADIRSLSGFAEYTTGLTGPQSTGFPLAAPHCDKAVQLQCLFSSLHCPCFKNCIFTEGWIYIDKVTSGGFAPDAHSSPLGLCLWTPLGDFCPQTLCGCAHPTSKPWLRHWVRKYSTIEEQGRI